MLFFRGFMYVILSFFLLDTVLYFPTDLRILHPIKLPPFELSGTFKLNRWFGNAACLPPEILKPRQVVLKSQRFCNLTPSLGYTWQCGDIFVVVVITQGRLYYQNSADRSGILLNVLQCRRLSKKDLSSQNVNSVRVGKLWLRVSATLGKWYWSGL